MKKYLKTLLICVPSVIVVLCIGLFVHNSDNASPIKNFIKNDSTIEHILQNTKIKNDSTIDDRLQNTKNNDNNNYEEGIDSDNTYRPNKDIDEEEQENNENSNDNQQRDKHSVVSNIDTYKLGLTDKGNPDSSEPLGEGETIKCGGFEISGLVNCWYLYENERNDVMPKTLYIAPKADANYMSVKISMSSKGGETDDRIYLPTDNDANVNIIFDNVHIKTNDGPPVWVHKLVGSKNHSNYNLTFLGNNTLTSEGENNAALELDDPGANVNISGIKSGNQNSMLVCRGASDAAAIGGGEATRVSPITIDKGVDIDAHAGYCGAAIGSGLGGYETKIHITRDAGKITAETPDRKVVDEEKAHQWFPMSSYHSGAAIGTGSAWGTENVYEAEINIEGGDITAKAAYGAAAIGNGYYATSSSGDKRTTINISGGKIFAESSRKLTDQADQPQGCAPPAAASIGGGYYSKDAAVRITGGEIKAIGEPGNNKEAPPAIGYGINCRGSVNSPIISGGNVHVIATKIDPKPINYDNQHLRLLRISNPNKNDVVVNRKQKDGSIVEQRYKGYNGTSFDPADAKQYLYIAPSEEELWGKNNEPFDVYLKDGDRVCSTKQYCYDKDKEEFIEIPIKVIGPNGSYSFDDFNKQLIIHGIGGQNTEYTLQNNYGNDPIRYAIQVRPVNDSGHIKINLNNINLDTSMENRPPFAIEDGQCSDDSDKYSTTINLIDGSDNILKGGNNSPGLQKNHTKKLIITGGSDIKRAGQLSAYGGCNAAGIGSNYKCGFHNLEIYGGKIKAYGGEGGSGIGSGDDYLKDFSPEIHDYTPGIHTSNILISGNALIEAHGGDSSAGIGGGRGNVKDADGAGDPLPRCLVENITISGSANVTAIGKNRGSGIGGGSDSNVKNITITDNAKVDAEGASGGAGIGCGYARWGYSTLHAENINISGNSVVKAKGGFDAAGIGGGWNTQAYNINILGGTVTSTGIQDAKDIGAGSLEKDRNDESTVTLTGGSVKATNNKISNLKDKDNKPLALLALNNPNKYNVKINDKEINPPYSPFDDGNLYVYIPIEYGSDGQVVTVELYNHEGSKEKYTYIYKKNKNIFVKGTAYVPFEIDNYDCVKLDFDEQILHVIDPDHGGAVDVRLRNKEINKATDWSIVVDANKAPSANITLDGVNIDTTEKNRAAMEISTNACDVTISLGDDTPLPYNSHNKLISANGRAGLQKNNVSKQLIIQGKQGTYSGFLHATGGQYAAGIGACPYAPAGNIIIKSGVVDAVGGQYASGIGGGLHGSGSYIYIEGGTVTAKGSVNEGIEYCDEEDAYDIGDGQGAFNADSAVCISGGSVKAVHNRITKAVDKITKDRMQGVALLKLDNPNASKVKINNEIILNPPYNHTAFDPKDTILYTYLPNNIGEAQKYFAVELLNDQDQVKEIRHYHYDKLINEFVDCANDLPFVVSDFSQVEYDKDNKQLNIIGKEGESDISLSIKNRNPEQSIDNTIVVKPKDNIKNITLNLEGVNIDVSDTENKCAFELDISKDESNVNLALNLSDNSKNYLHSGSYCAALEKNDTAKFPGNLTIGSNGNGSLECMGGLKAPGIGSSSDNDVSNVVFKGGNITSTGGHRATGIGAGVNRHASNFTFEGGKIVANGGPYGPGIGGTVVFDPKSKVTDKEVATNFVFSGSNVTATGGGHAVGIGSHGDKQANAIAKDIKFTGGVVKAIGGFSSPGIGCEAGSKATDITFTGGTVTATGNGGADDIGLGEDSEQGFSPKIFVQGGSIKCTRDKMYKVIYDKDVKEGGWFLAPFVLQNPDSHKILINNKVYEPANHLADGSGDTNLYTYQSVTYDEENPLFVTIIDNNNNATAKSYYFDGEKFVERTQHDALYLRSLLNAANDGDTVHVDSDITLKENANLIEAGKNVKLDLGGHVLNMGSNAIHVLNDAHLSIVNGTVTGHKTNSQNSLENAKIRSTEPLKAVQESSLSDDAKREIITGAVAFFNEGSLSLDNVRVVDNTDELSTIYNCSDSDDCLRIENSTFTNNVTGYRPNTESNNTTLAWGGSCLFNVRGKAIINNTTMSDCHAESCSGGAINNVSELEATELNINKCSAAYGGAIFNSVIVKDIPTSLSIKRCSIQENYAAKLAGGIATGNGATLVIGGTHNTIAKNTSQSNVVDNLNFGYDSTGRISPIVFLSDFDCLTCDLHISLAKPENGAVISNSVPNITEDSVTEHFVSDLETYTITLENGKGLIYTAKKIEPKIRGLENSMPGIALKH